MNYSAVLKKDGLKITHLYVHQEMDNTNISKKMSMSSTSPVSFLKPVSCVLHEKFI